MQKKTTGQQVKAAREALDWTQEQLVSAMAAHGEPVTKPFISLLENDLRQPSVATAGALSAVLGISLDDLLAQHTVPTP